MLLGVALLTVVHAQDRGARSDDAAFASEEGKYTPAPLNRLWYSNATYARVNPLGLINNYQVGWRRRLSKKDSTLFQDTYAFVGPAATITPAWTRVGLSAEAQALAVLRVFGRIDGVGYYGTFDQILPFDAASPYSDQTIADRGDEASATTGWLATLGATVRAKVGPIAVRNTGQAVHMDLALDGGTHFYDQLSDRLVPDGGWVVLNDADVLYVAGPLRLGARHSFTDTLDGSGDTTDAALANHRLGPLFAWQFSDKKPGARFNQPTFFAIAQWWLQHPYRTGAEQPQALPLIALGLSFNGDLATSR
jgi:hypothetical protein